jgi:EpsI family protein
MKAFENLVAWVVSMVAYGSLTAWLAGAVFVVFLISSGRRHEVRELLHRYRAAVSIFSIAAMLVLVDLGFRAVNAGTEPPDVHLPPKGWLDASFPLQFEAWQGTRQEIDDKVTRASEAYDSVSRMYSDPNGRSISVHMALYRRPKEAVYHTPLNCYRSQAWEQKSQVRAPLTVPNSDVPPIEVNLTTWEKRSEAGPERVMVLFWYELGDNILYERGDLLWAHWAMRGERVWPPTFKVLLQVPLTDQSREHILIMAEHIRRWIHDQGQKMSSAQDPS